LRLQDTINILKKFCDVLQEFQSEPIITIEYLEGVAGVRFALMEIAGLLHSSFVDDSVKKSPLEQQLQFEILQLAEEFCVDPNINTSDFSTSEDVFGPAIYLLKLLVRQYGFPCLKYVSELHPWIIPEDLRTTDQVVISCFMFV